MHKNVKIIFSRGIRFNLIFYFQVLLYPTIKILILTVGSEVGRLGGVECSVTFSSWMPSDDDSVPAGASMAFVDTGLPTPVEVCVPCVGEAADEGASTVLFLVLEGEGWK